MTEINLIHPRCTSNVIISQYIKISSGRELDISPLCAFFLRKIWVEWIVSNALSLAKSRRSKNVADGPSLCHNGCLMDVLARSMLCCGAIFPRHRKATPSLIRDDDYSDWGGRDGRDRITGVFLCSGLVCGWLWSNKSSLKCRKSGTKRYFSPTTRLCVNKCKKINKF